MKLNVQDLITVGIFSAIYLIVVFAFGMLGYIPAIMVLLPLLAGIVGGIPFMLFLTKVDKFGMVTIMALIVGIVMFLSGHSWIPIITFLICGIIADYIFKLGNYRSSKNSIIGYSIFCLGVMGNMLPLWIMKDTYMQEMTAMMGSEYVSQISWMVQDWVFVALIIATIIGGMIGALIGKKILAKHFQKAGIV
ncbi:MptD family putative ECF transporter S component [Methanobrevibacter sp. DSM 116169]|uniref:MptD family putative ECF transporter S component n=1 Tax=Methanobrevibacter sp. DSM 116169 TaxID=3242727 RepID=UPI0038FCB5EF